MREIKFRIWKPEQRQWVDFPMRGIYSHKALIDSVYTDSEYFIVQQYTGLKDSKGTEIYEGDILKIKDRLLCEKVIFLFGSFGFHLNYKNSKDSRRKDNDPADFCSISEFYESELEIIGNVFENPELLK